VGTRLQKLREPLAVTLAALLIGALYAYPVVRHFGTFEVGQDWDQHLVYHWVPWDTVVRFHQVPLWNPYLCGGTPLLANPPTRILMPFFLLHLLAGPVAGIHLEIILHLALIAAGGWVLGRTLGLSRLAAATIGLVFLGCSAHYLHLAVGHVWFVAYAYLPWVAAGTWRSIETRRLVPAALAGLVLAIQIGEGGIYPAPHAAILIVVVTLVTALARRDRWPLVVLATTAGFGFALSAVRLLPTLALMADHPRLIDSPESVGPRMLLHALFWRGAEPPVLPEMDWGFHEYGTYLSPAAVVLALAGLGAAWRRGSAWLVAAAVFLALAFGDVGAASPWRLLHGLPLFASQHVPSRFLTPFVFVTAIVCGFGVDALQQRGRRAGLAAAALAIVAAADGFLVGPPLLERIFEFAPAPSGRFSFARPLTPTPRFHQTLIRQGRSMFMTAQSNRGVIDCYDPIHLTVAVRAFGDPEYRGEQHLTGAGTLRLARWSPNALEYDVDLPAPTDLVVNQNFYPAWTLTGGTGTTFDDDGLVGVHLPAGAQHLVLRYVDRSFWLGLVISLAGLVALAGLAVREPREPAAREQAAPRERRRPAATGSSRAERRRRR
jgi:hypothetical protein